MVYIMIFLQTELLIVSRQAFIHCCELPQVWEQRGAHALNSEHAQSALGLPVDAHWLVMPISVYVHIHLGLAGYLKAKGAKKDSIPDMIKIELASSISVKRGIVFPDVDCLLNGPG